MSRLGDMRLVGEAMGFLGALVVDGCSTRALVVNGSSAGG